MSLTCRSHLRLWYNNASLPSFLIQVALPSIRALLIMAPIPAPDAMNDALWALILPL